MTISADDSTRHPTGVAESGAKGAIDPTDIVIRPTRYGAPAARMLVNAAMADLESRYGSVDANPVEAVEFDPPEGGFLVAWVGGEPVACGGWRTLSHYADEAAPPDVAEMKRMYAVPSVRGTGVASAVLSALEASAKQRGMRRIVLETGYRQPEAIAFYVKRGYEQIANYGYYRDEPGCVCFGRDL